TFQDTPAGRQYIIEVPPVRPASSAAILDLYRARTVIDEHDFRIVQFEASGSLLRQPYSVSFTLLRRSVRASADVRPEEFEIAGGPGDVVLNGTSGSDPVTDALTVV